MSLRRLREAEEKIDLLEKDVKKNSKRIGEITALARGPMGPQGPAGEPGSPTYLHDQSSESSSWTINHNLGFRPNITLTTTGGSVFEAEIVHTSNNQAVAYFNTNMAGKARCN